MQDAGRLPRETVGARRTASRRGALSFVGERCPIGQPAPSCDAAHANSVLGLAPRVRWAAPMRALCLELTDRIPELLREIDAVAAEESMDRAPCDPRPERLGPALAAMFDWALCPDRREPERPRQRRRAIVAAADHGRARREQCAGDDAVLRDYYLARVVVGRAAARLARDEGELMEAMRGLDRAITEATRAALVGFHAPELEERGQWPARLHELCDEADLAGRVRD
jgi:hypothetical protein